MCLALPGKVIEIDGKTARVEFSGNKVNVDISLVEVKVGEYVLVHAGCAIAVVPEDEALETIDLFAQVEEYGKG